MSVQLSTRDVESVLYRGFRDLRSLGHNTPGVSIEREAMRELELLQEDGVVEDHQVQMTIFEDGQILIDLQVE